MLLKQPKLRQAQLTPGAGEAHTGNITGCSSTWTQTLSSALGPRHRAGNQLEMLLIERTDFGNEFGLLSGSPSFLSPAGMSVSFLSFAGQRQGQGQVLASCSYWTRSQRP